MNRLEEILEVKREEIEQLRPRTAELDREARARTDFRDFRSALHRDDEVFAVIAEIKKASPSAGLIAKSFDPVEIAKNYERAAANGADAILLIVAALAQDQLVRLLKGAKEFRLDALVEVHSVDELQRALEAGAEIVGINNRDLTTFDVDLAVTEELCRHVPDEVILVSESGIKTPRDVARMKACGVDALLVGEALMRGEI